MPPVILSVSLRHAHDAPAVYTAVETAAITCTMVCFIMGTSLKPPSAGCARTPSRIVPKNPPTPWTPKTSRASS